MIRQDDGARLTARHRIEARRRRHHRLRRLPASAAPAASASTAGASARPRASTAEALSQSAVLLRWTDGATNETEFRIEARSGAGAFAEVATVPANTVFVAVEELAAASEHTFRVRARNATGFSSYSNVATATTAAGASACVPDAGTACLLGGEFRITGTMKNFDTPPATFELEVMDFAAGRAESDEAAFWESFEPGNFEVATKMKDACSLPVGDPLRFYWAFFGGLTNQRTDMAIRDTVTGETVTWTNPANQFPTSVADTAAFPCVTPGAPGACTRDQDTACLIGGRFEVTGTMRDESGQTFVTRVISTLTPLPGAGALPPHPNRGWASRWRGPAPRPTRPPSSSPSSRATSRWE